MTGSKRHPSRATDVIAREGGLCAIVAVTLVAGALAPVAAQSSDPPAGTSAPVDLPGVDLNLGHFSGTLNHLSVSPFQVVYNRELTVRADAAQGDLLRQQYLATGNVRVHEADTTLTSTSLQFDAQKNQGVAADALLVQPMFTVRARQIDVAADALTAQRVSLTNVPPGVRPDFEVRAGTLDLLPDRRRGTLRNASLYLFRTRLLTLPRLSFSFGPGASVARQAILPVIGVSSRYGLYASYRGNLPGPVDGRIHLFLPTRQAPQLQVTAQQTLFPRPQAPQDAPAPTRRRDYLGAIRRLATAPKPLLPAGDPLLFHSYLPEASGLNPLAAAPTAGLTLAEDVATNQESRGRRIDNLYVSRLPEVTLAGRLPLGRVSTPTPPSDPAAFRQSLRRLVLVADAQASYGYYEEKPGNRHATRQRDVLGLTTRPLLVAPNTLFQPRVQLTTNYYSGQGNAYRYGQVDLELAHYFSDRSQVGVGFLDATTHGDSPFNFDVLDTTRELDGWVQVGDRRLAVAGLVRYDLQRGGVIDYKLAVAPGLHGITPVFSYNFRNRSFGVALDIEGLGF